MKRYSLARQAPGSSEPEAGPDLRRVYVRPRSGSLVDLRAVPGVGAEIVLTVDGEWRRTRLYRAHEQAELSGAIADTRAALEVKGWE